MESRNSKISCQVLKYLSERLKQLNQLHSCVGNSAKILNDVASAQLLLIVLRSFVDFLSASHEIIRMGVARCSVLYVFRAAVAAVDLVVLMMPSRATVQAVSL